MRPDKLKHIGPFAEVVIYETRQAKEALKTPFDRMNRKFRNEERRRKHEFRQNVHNDKS